MPTTGVSRGRRLPRNASRLNQTRRATCQRNSRLEKTPLWDSTETVLEMNLKKLPSPLPSGHEARGSTELESSTLPRQSRHENGKTAIVCSQHSRRAETHQRRPAQGSWGSQAFPRRLLKTLKPAITFGKANTFLLAE